MFLNEDFLNIYEELSDLNEAKADTQNLINFAGEDLANRFLNIRNRLKTPENDLYYWIKNKTPEDLEQAILSAEQNKSKTQNKKDVADTGAKLVQETDHWKVYHITTFAASQKYGRDTKWCITGINSYGDKYWKEYTDKGIQFYFLISKDNYSDRGRDSKFAIAKSEDINEYEIYNQQDEQVDGTDIPHFEEISIPGVDLNQSYSGNYCNACNTKLYDDRYDDGYQKGADGELYCDKCFDELFFKCTGCDKICVREDEELDYDEEYCDECYTELLDQEDDYDPYSWG